MASNSDELSVDPVLRTARRDLKSLAVKLGDAFNVSLPVPQFQSLTYMKEWCATLLPSSKEPISGGSRFNARHDWFRPTSTLSCRDRLSVAGSLFLFRKVLPSKAPSLSAYASKMSISSPPPDPKFMQFVSDELPRMFPVGWDKRWSAKVRGTTVRPASCLESSRKRGGALGCLERAEWVDREEFCRELLDRYSAVRPIVNKVRVTTAPTDGKVRIVTVNSIDMTYVDPYHRLVYDQISALDWCLRGEATASRFSSFVTRPGEVFVSGDYESATDNLNQHVARHVLSIINRSCGKVPLFVRDAASDLLDCEASCSVGGFRVARGQLMGNSMSFPLLCIQNYLAFRYFVRRDVPLKINGDDIVFRSTPDEFCAWKDGVESCGLTLSMGKTMTDGRVFSLNSTFFVAGSVHVKLAPVIRSTCYFKKLERPSALTGRLETLKGFRPEVRSRLMSSMLSRFAASVWASQRSLRRGYGVRVSPEALRMSGLLERESFYLSLDKFYDPGFPQAQEGYFVSEVPAGWTRVRCRAPVDQAVQKAFYETLVAESWKPKAAKGPSVEKLRFTAHFCAFPKRKYAVQLGWSSSAWRKARVFLPRSPKGEVARWTFVGEGAERVAPTFVRGSVLAGSLPC